MRAILTIGFWVMIVAGYAAGFTIFQLPAFVMYNMYGFNWVTIATAIFFTALYIGLLWRYSVPPFNKN